MFRKLLQNDKADGLMGAIILLIGIMMTIAIVAIVSFSFLSATSGAYEVTDTQNIILASTPEYIDISNNNPVSSTITVQRYNTTSTLWETVPTANFSYISANNTVSVDAGAMDATNHTQLRANYNMEGYTTNSDLISYALIVFGLLVIIPLVIVGGLMLKSLGYFGGGKV